MFGLLVGWLLVIVNWTGPSCNGSMQIGDYVCNVKTFFSYSLYFLLNSS